MIAIFNKIDINILSLIICALLLFDISKRSEKHQLEYKLFDALLISNMILLVLDAVMWMVDGKIFVNPILYSSVNVLYYIMNPVPSFLWLLYADYKVKSDEKRVRKIFWPFLLPVIANTVLALITPFTGLMFFIDENHIYHRGPWFPVLIAIAYFYVIYAFILILRNRNRIEKRYFAALLWFPVAPAVCGILQSLFYGLALVWSGLTLSLLIVYLNIQNRILNTDYLTGICNRLQLDSFLQEKIRNSSVQNSFGGILLDIDNFKTINDDYGHIVGDEALATFANLVKEILRKDDFLARYGGDEFVAILNASSTSDLKKSVKRINENIKAYNLQAGKPYQFSVSMGYDLYDPNSGMNKSQFIKHIDKLMYEWKNEAAG